MRETGKCVLCTDTTQLIWVYYEYMYIRMCYICTPFLSLSITFVVSKEGLRLLLFSLSPSTSSSATCIFE